MNSMSRLLPWFGRIVLAAATLVMTSIAARNLIDPVAANLPLGIVLASPSAVTVARVGFGGFPLGFAAALFVCLVRRHTVAGLSLVLAVVGGALVARVQGLMLDGATPYNVGLLKPELAMVTLSVVGIALEWRYGGGRGELAASRLQPTVSR